MALTVLAGCATTHSDSAALEAKIQQLEINQRLLAGRLKMTNAVMPEEIDYMDGVQIGDPNAPYVLMEFTDLQCPYCAKFNSETFPEFKEKYVDTGEVLFVARELPLNSIHPQAAPAAVALRCSYEQKPGVYSEFKATLFANGKVLNKDFYLEQAQQFGLDAAQFEQCLTSPEQIKSVNDAYKYAVGIGFQSTPSFVFGQNTGRSAANYRTAKGALTLDRIEQGLEAIK